MEKKRCEWQAIGVTKEIGGLLDLLSEEYPPPGNNTGKILSFVLRNAGMKVSSDENRITVEYSSLCEAARGIGMALAGIDTEEIPQFDSLGIMIDCSRNAVIKVSHFKRWLRRLALLGYNLVMIYTEDTFLVPGEDILGYQRGAYSLDELREMDAYAAALGIEMVPCIQTLGHMEQVIKWEESLGGTRSTLLTGSERVYSMLNHILGFWRSAFRSKKIHIGMDESWHETGKQFDEELRQFKYRIFLSHLKRVNELCRKNGYEHPMIWSDMFFNISSRKNFYFDTDVQFKDEMKHAIPADIRLVYWDYYHETPDIYGRMIAKHRELGFEPVMASGIRTTKCFWYDHTQTMRAVPPCIEACKKENIREIFFTMWGDDGAFCDYDSAFTGMTLCADLAWGGKGEADKMEKQFSSVCGGSYMRNVRAAGLQLYFDRNLDAWAPYLLWDDPLLGLVWRYFETKVPGFWDEAEKRLAALKEELFPFRHEHTAGDIGNAWALAGLLEKKIRFRRDLLADYQDGNLAKIAERAEKEMTEAIDTFAMTFRRQWRHRNKPEGLELMQYRLAGLTERYRETARLIREYLAGDRDALKMLEEKRALPVFYLFHNCASAARSIFH